MEFINIHTHNHNTNAVSVINLFPEDVDNVIPEKFYSVGIHPWNVSKINVSAQLQIISEIVTKENVIAVGEIGLDKLHPEFDLQKEIFLKQLYIAEELKKPVIVHCVKAFSELLEILKDEKQTVPIIIHRYSGNITIAEQLLKYGCYFSFGYDLFNSKSKVMKVFKKIPKENIFLETDDAYISIENVYQKAAEIKEISIKNISEYILSNFNLVFGNIYPK
ncbi:MAG: TatD family hydrolase [Chlorobi bacterium]|nr:TatD family hydrolase [Chlorobiota bacterium]